MRLLETFSCSSIRYRVTAVPENQSSDGPDILMTLFDHAGSVFKKVDAGGQGSSESYSFEVTSEQAKVVGPL